VTLNEVGSYTFRTMVLKLAPGELPAFTQYDYFAIMSETLSVSVDNGRSEAPRGVTEFGDAG
jgi:hypothetical protein